MLLPVEQGDKMQGWPGAVLRAAVQYVWLHHALLANKLLGESSMSQNRSLKAGLAGAWC